MERCPTCRAKVREDTQTCARCGTDLSRLLAIEVSAGHHLGLALAHLNAGREDVALQEIERSLQLKRDPLALTLRGFMLERRGVWRQAKEDERLVGEEESPILINPSNTV